MLQKKKQALTYPMQAKVSSRHGGVAMATKCDNANVVGHHRLRRKASNRQGCADIATLSHRQTAKDLPAHLPRGATYLRPCSPPR